MTQIGMPWHPADWAEWITAAAGTLGIIGSILKVGANAVRANARLAVSVNSLAEGVTRIEDRVEVFISSVMSSTNTLNGWQREVDGRLAGIEARLDAMAGTRRDRRKTD